MSYDFVICDNAATVIAAIELDDKSHESEHRSTKRVIITRKRGDCGRR
jgi:Protein of unknown function (DUF2726)